MSRLEARWQRHSGQAWLAGFADVLQGQGAAVAFTRRAAI